MRHRSVHADRGAILVQTVIMMVGLTAFSSFVIDYGILWSARRQAQNSADAAALAAAGHLAFGGMTDIAGARTAALDAAARNLVWGEPPDVTAGDIVVPVECPSNAPGFGTTPAPICVRVDVFRNQRAGGNPLPTIFGTLVGAVSQGVQATATAEVLYANSATCVKPLAVPDRWIEAHTPPWDSNDTFRRYVSGSVLPIADVYVPPTPGNNGSGFDLALDYGLELPLRRYQDVYGIQSTWYFPVELECPGATPGTLECVLWNVANCSPEVVGEGGVLTMTSGSGVAIAPVLADLIARDSTASWNAAANGGRGGIVGGCMAAGTCTVSPRLIAVPMIDPDAWDQESPVTRSTVTVTRVVGMFIEMQAGEVVGRLVPYPSAPNATNLGVPGSAFVVSTILVR